MMDNPPGREMSRSNINLIPVSLIILSILLVGALVTHKYWYNFAFGPFATDADSLFANPAELNGRFVVMKGEKVISTEYEQSNQSIHRKSNQVESEKVTAYYLLLRCRDKAVMVRSPYFTREASFEGRLVSIPPDVYEQLISPLNPDLQKHFAPLMLDAESYRYPGFIGLGIALPLVAFSLFNLCRKLQTEIAGKREFDELRKKM